LDRYDSLIPGPYYKTGPFSIQTLSIILFSIVFVTLRSHFEALKSVLLIFFLVYASKKYDQTDSCAPKCLPRVTKKVMYIVSRWALAYKNTWYYLYKLVQFNHSTWSTGFPFWLPNMTWGGTKKIKFQIETLETGDMHNISSLYATL
jgi:hypothetical protein